MNEMPRETGVFHAMKYRKLDADGDYQLGHGNLDFYQDQPEAVAQSAMTRLQLWQGQWFIDTTSGTPWLQQILGKRMAVESVLRSRILGTQGVIELQEMSLQYNPDTRSVAVNAVIVTTYGTTTVTQEVTA